MTYDEFASKSLEYYMDMVRLIDIKQKHRMSLTEDEKQISDYIIETQERNKINELRNKFEKCWDIEE
jgi:uncharacterized membrane protein